jgi:hypothetical protein
MGFLPGTTLIDSAKLGALFDSRNHLWRKWADILVLRSFGLAVWETLIDSAAQFGAEIA